MVYMLYTKGAHFDPHEMYIVHHEMYMLNLANPGLLTGTGRQPYDAKKIILHISLNLDMIKIFL